jgi:hypothetical protein
MRREDQVDGQGCVGQAGLVISCAPAVGSARSYARVSGSWSQELVERAVQRSKRRGWKK